MATANNEYFTEVLETLNEYQDYPVRSSEKLFAASWMREKNKWNVK